MRFKLVKRGFSDKCRDMWKISELRSAKVTDQMYMLFVKFKEPKYFDVIGCGWSHDESGRLESFHINFDVENSEDEELENICIAELHLVPETEEERKFLEEVEVLSWCDKYGARIIIVSWEVMSKLYECSTPLKVSEELIKLKMNA